MSNVESLVNLIELLLKSGVVVRLAGVIFKLLLSFFVAKKGVSTASTDAPVSFKDFGAKVGDQIEHRFMEPVKQAIHEAKKVIYEETKAYKKLQEARQQWIEDLANQQRVDEAYAKSKTAEKIEFRTKVWPTLTAAAKARIKERGYVPKDYYEGLE
jgi:hypothetical protein